MVVDALPVLEQVMRMMSLVAQEKGTELTYRAEGTCTMLATRDEIHQIIYNLTDNAVKYTPPGSTVQVSLFREGDQVVLTVAAVRRPSGGLRYISGESRTSISWRRIWTPGGSWRSRIW